MSASGKARQLFVSLLLSSRIQALSRQVRQFKRRWLREDAVVSVFLRLDDPYSLLLARRLPALAQAYSIKLRLYLVDHHIPEDLDPDAERLKRFSRIDAAMIAAMTGEAFDAGNELVDHKSGVRALLCAELENPAGESCLLAVKRVFEAYWAGDKSALTTSLGRLNSIALEKSRQAHKKGVAALIEGGHFRPATLRYDGEWFWGIDRLHFLLALLDKQGLARSRRSDLRIQLKADIGKLNPLGINEIRIPAGQVLDVYFSFRSPYSYLALCRLQLLEETQGLKFRLRPVLPMVKRGLKVPRSKQIQIVKDTAREAQRYAISFGKFVDPLDAVEELLGLFVRAEASGSGMAFSLAVLRAAWARGIDLCNPSRRAELMREHGLALSTPCNTEQLAAGLALAKKNRERLTALDLWGVPSFHINGHKTWGQDRLALLLNTTANEEALS